MSFIRRLFPLVALTLSGNTIALADSNCSRADIDHYLDRGFTHEQVLKLCGGETPANNATPQPTDTPAIISAPPAPVVQPSTPVVTQPAVPKAGQAEAVAAQPTNSGLATELAILRTAVEADTLDITDDAIIYSFNDCLKYGDPGYSTFKPEACVNTKTRIARAGMSIENVQKGIFLLRETELIVSGDIQRELEGLDNLDLKPEQREQVLADYPLRPATLNIAVRKGIDPQKVADVLKKLVK